ncbi:hypothetical protein FCULG_00000158 [Fusarium culmorum]|uniref:Catechol dioxygenase N-terminal domain-containing protein n=1 Tax=Fusarium culmorum TaxID=5516 RepID=A0A2T4GQT7_FUSCU|nr:hypothetical protein FCULG_00000158 [Fusarium culmorum]
MYLGTSIGSVGEKAITQNATSLGSRADLRYDTITQAVININASNPNARFKFVMERLHKRVDGAIQFLTATGQKCTELRQEFILLSDILGLSLLMDSIDHPKPPGSTVGSLLGPFHTDDANQVAHGTQISDDTKVEPLLVIGSVKD